MPSESNGPLGPGGASGPKRPAQDPIERIEAALTKIGAEHEPPAGWEARVLAATATAPPPRRAWWPRWATWIALPTALAAAAALVFVVMPEDAEALRLAIAIEAGPVVVRSSSADPQLGDTVHATVTGGGAHRSVRIYRNEAELVVECPGPASCQRTDTTATVDLKLTQLGTYQIVVMASDAPLPRATGHFDADAAAANRANLTISRQDLTVR